MSKQLTLVLVTLDTLMMDLQKYVRYVIILVVLVRGLLYNALHAQQVRLGYWIQLRKHVNAHLGTRILPITQYVLFALRLVINVELNQINVQHVILIHWVTEPL